jgi:hypothetical protein
MGKAERRDGLISNVQFSTTEMRGIKYCVTSFYGGERTIYDRMGNLILNAFHSSKERGITEESSLGLDIDKAKKL